MVLLMTTEKFGFIVDYLTGKTKTVEVPLITSAIWHPRQAGRLLIGRSDGKVVLYDWKNNKSLMEYETPQLEESKTKENEYKNKIIDVCFSPGEDVFLVLRADGGLYLFG